MLPAERGTGRWFSLLIFWFLLLNFLQRNYPICALFFRRNAARAGDLYTYIYIERERDTGFGRNCGASAKTYTYKYIYIHTYIGSGRNCVASAKTLVVSSAMMKARWKPGATHLKAKQGFWPGHRYADVCWRVLTSTGVCWRMLTYAGSQDQLLLTWDILGTDRRTDPRYCWLV